MQINDDLIYRTRTKAMTSAPYVSDSRTLLKLMVIEISLLLALSVFCETIQLPQFVLLFVTPGCVNMTRFSAL